MRRIETRDLPDLIRRPIVSEKATILLEGNQYVFEVVPQATKPQIKAAIEIIFDVKVTSVNTMNLPRKKRRVGKYLGYKSQYKKTIVTLAQGSSIALFPEV
ncbi:50S ribosomal protein L23 [Merismopedia glauca]|uniref:Large ribosomal subunit protein uL23 n=1 Tax=Merismopedia glauca CCAP 1448/3 TaxID=1296344 RepID=A0A2T1BZ50_9CYAN|nr:50S ribosomal protein L23 [Merismopedia glauca]PSB01178.1 50S ribosomal protein L23 [Merismopedia glauca CCAP 1448/3]